MQDFLSDVEILEVVVGTYRRLLTAASDAAERGLIVDLIRQAEAQLDAAATPPVGLRPNQTLH